MTLKLAIALREGFIFHKVNLTCVVGHSPLSLSIVYAELVCFVSWIVQLAL